MAKSKKANVEEILEIEKEVFLFCINPQCSKIDCLRNYCNHPPRGTIMNATRYYPKLITDKNNVTTFKCEGYITD